MVHTINLTPKLKPEILDTDVIEFVTTESLGNVYITVGHFKKIAQAHNWMKLDIIKFLIYFICIGSQDNRIGLKTAKDITEKMIEICGHSF